ncbi:MAG: LCP family protein [Bacilli bacterium]|nr:LCP family protein [Bacilli bacterium]
MKKGKKIFLNITLILVLILLGLSTLFIIYDLYLFSGILKFYRIMGAIILILLSILLGQALCFSKRKKLWKYIVWSIITIIYSITLLIGGYYVYRVINNLDYSNKETKAYKVSIITFKDDLKEFKDLDGYKIGMVSDENDVTNYILPKEIINDENLEDFNQLIEYDNTLDLITALYKEEVDAIFIDSEFESLYGKLEEYSDISKKAKVIKTFEKDADDIETEIVDKVAEKKLTEPFTILLLGVDSEEDGLNPNAAFNGDTMMLISFNPNTLQATMFSVPRDTYVPISCSGGRLNKVNTAAYGGTSCVVNTLQNLTGLTIDYYAMVNFRAVVDLVDSLGKITVNVPMSFCESDSYRRQGEYELCLSEGIQELSGEQALALARHRKTLLLGDFQRGQNQQLVVEGILNKIKEIRSVNQVIETLDIINKNISTNITREQILSLYEVGKDMIVGNNTNLFNIQKTFLTGYDLNVYEPAAQGVRYAFFHYKQSLNSIVSAMKQTLGIEQIIPIKTFSFSINELYEKEIIGYEYYAESRYPVVPTFYSISDAMSFANSYNLPFKVIDNDTKEEVTSNFDEYYLVWQDERPNTLVVRLTSVTVYAVKANPDKPEDEKDNEEDNEENDDSTTDDESSSEDNTSSSDENEENNTPPEEETSSEENSTEE